MSKEQEVKDSADMPDKASVDTQPAQRGEFIKMDLASREFVQKYGQPDLHTFLVMVGSDGVLAQRVITDLLNDKFGVSQTPYAPALDVQAPQENNITGKLDNTGDVATKLHTDGESEAEPPVVVDVDGADNTGKKSKK